MQSSEISDLLSRVCDHLGIAFSANRVFPGLADLSQDRKEPDLNADLNAIGKQFGIRFRPLSGSIKHLIYMVNDSGPVLVSSRGIDGSFETLMLVLEIKSRGRILVHRNGEDVVVSIRWLQKQLGRDGENNFNWQLIQPVYVAQNASRIHYNGGREPRQLTPMKRFIGLLRPDFKDIRTIVIFSVVIGLLSLTTPLAVEAVVNTIAFGRYLQPLIILSIIVLVFLGFRAALNILMTVVTEILQRKLFVRTVEDLSYRLTRVPLQIWNDYHGPELVNRFFDIANVQKITSKLLLETLMLILQTVIGLTVLAFYHPFLLGYDIGLLVMMTFVLWLIGRGAVRTAKEESQLKFRTGAWLQEIARHPTTFKFNGGLGFALNRADELAAQYINHRQQHFRILIKQMSFAMIMQVIAATALLALGGYLVIEGQMTLGQLVAAELIVTVILGSFAKLGKDLESYYDLMASVDKLGKLFDLPVERADKLVLARQPGAYGLKIVDFALENESIAQLDFEPGYSYAICGSGELNRSNLINSLNGIIKPARGYVLLNDYRVDAISSESLQAKIGIVRDIEIFEGSIDENLRMGRENVGSRETNDIIERLGIRKTIAALDNGLNTTIRVNGFPLSRGDAIRLVLARALISRPGILFIDGILDWLSDLEIENTLQRLRSFTKDTTIVVSTGRKVISGWADFKLDLNHTHWEFERNKRSE